MSFAVLDTLRRAERLERGGFTEQQARTQAHAFSEVVLDHVPTKKNLSDVHAGLKRDIEGVRDELKQDIAEARTELKQDIVEVHHKIDSIRTELKQDIAEVHHKIDSVQLSLEKSIAELRLGLEKTISETRSLTIQWTVGIVLGAGLFQTGIITALILRLMH